VLQKAIQRHNPSQKPTFSTVSVNRVIRATSSGDFYLLACDHFGCLMSHALGDFGASSSELQRQKPGKTCRAAKVDSVHYVPTQARALGMRSITNNLDCDPSIRRRRQTAALGQR
jgi:hypothetical protein